MESIGAAAARGLESGFGLGLRGAAMRADEEQRRRLERDAQQQRENVADERTYRRSRDQVADRRQAAQEERQARMDELTMIDGDMAALQAEGQALWGTYGGFEKVPEDVRKAYTGRVRDLRGRRAAVRRTFHSPTVEDLRRDAAATWSRIQAGQISPDSLSGDDLLRTITAQTGRTVADFLGGKDGSPSAIRQAVLDVEAGLQAGNQDLLIKGANVLLARELLTGVGSDGPDGNEIIRKQLVALAPHPKDPAKVVPILEVTVRRDDGAVGTYRAPATEDRGVWSGNTQAVPKAIPVQALVERLGEFGAMEAWLNQPENRQRLDGASPEAKSTADEFLQALGAVGVSPPKPGKISRERVDLGSHIEEREVDERSGKVLSVRRLPKGAPPKASGTDTVARGLDILPDLPRGVTGQAVLDALDDGDAAIVEGLANGSIRPAEISTRGNRRERMLALAKRFDPSADFGPDGRLKEVPAAVRTAALENQTNLRRAERALRLTGGAPAREGEQADPEATGWKGYVPNQLLNRWDPEGVEARAAIADLGSLVIHDRSGAAVTAAEFPRLAPFIPSEKDDAETVKKKLRGFVTVYKEELQAMEQAYSKDNGYKGISFQAGDGGKAASGGARDGSAQALPAAARARLKEGQVTKFGNGTRWTLHNGQPVEVK